MEYRYVEETSESFEFLTWRLINKRNDQNNELMKRIELARARNFYEKKKKKTTLNTICNDNNVLIIAFFVSFEYFLLLLLLSNTIPFIEYEFY